jgi:hypothetical protein
VNALSLSSEEQAKSRLAVRSNATRYEWRRGRGASPSAKAAEVAQIPLISETSHRSSSPSSTENDDHSAVAASCPNPVENALVISEGQQASALGILR